MVASADSVEIDGIYYNLISKAKLAVVTSNPNKYSGSVVIPESVTFNEENYSVTSIGEGAFQYCSKLTSINIPNSVTSIGESAFNYCSGLSSVTIGSGIKLMLSYAFANCSNLTDVFCYAEQVPTTYNDAFNESYIDYATLHVPAESVNSYKATAPWSEFKEVVALESTEITAPTASQHATITESYDLNGRRASLSLRGLNIVKMSDGTTKKVVVK